MAGGPERCGRGLKCSDGRPAGLPSRPVPACGGDPSPACSPRRAGLVPIPAKITNACGLPRAGVVDAGGGRRVGRGISCVTVGVLVVGVLAGCTGGGEEPLGLSTVTAEPTPEATPTPTPTPTPATGVVLDMSDPELGIVFEDIPALEGDAADVYNWIATFEQESWRTLKTNEVSPAFSVFTSADVQARMEQIVANNTNDQFRPDGVFHVRISDISVDGDTARATTCIDYGQVTFTDVNGPVTLEDAGLAEPPLMEVTLARNTAGEGLWTIQTSERIGEC